LLLGLLLLLAGVVIGASGGVLVTRHVVHRAMKNPETVRDRYVARVKSQLNLDTDQVSKFDAIVAARTTGLRKIRMSTAPAVHEEFVTLNAEIRGLLSADQTKIWERHYARIQSLVPSADLVRD
jgi:microcompartment protein CcmL/EutN